MPLVKPAAPPGQMAQATQVQARGAWFAMNLCRWRTGLLEKMGGWKRLMEDALPSIVRRMHGWLDVESRKNLLIAADDGVYLRVQQALYPLGRQLALPGGYIPAIGVVGATTLFSVTSGSTEVTVKTTAAVAPGERFPVQLPLSIGGRIILAGSYFTVKAVTPGVSFTFDMTAPALATETDTYGIPLLTNDIVNGFTVTWKAHGLSIGDKFRLVQGATLMVGVTGIWEKVRFSAPAGTSFTVATVPDADHFTFAMGVFGTGDGLGGTDHQVYAGGKLVKPTGGVIVSSIAPVIGFGRAMPLGNPQNKAWFLANLGQDGLVLSTGSPLHVYHPPIEDGPFLSVVGGGSPRTAPQKSNGMLVAMPQGQVILWGSETNTSPGVFGTGVVDPLLIRWSDVGTYDQYTAAVDNQAGSYRLSRGSKIMAAIQAPQATIILTDTDLWQMSYIGPPLIYGFTIMGSGCGAVAPHAIGTIGRTTVWQGKKNFWQFDTGMQPVMCTVWDYIFEDVDPVNANKCHAAPNSGTNELAFYFPSKTTALTDTDNNQLLQSQEFSDLDIWSVEGALAVRYIAFTNKYVYEEGYVPVGWLDESGIVPISWFDSDVQGVQVTTELVKAPDGSGTAFTLIEAPVNSAHAIFQSINKPGEKITYTLSVYAHDSSTRNLTLRAESGGDSAFATFDVVSGNLVASGVSSTRFALLGTKVLIDDLGRGRSGTDPNGWRRYVMTFVSDDDPFMTLYFNATNGTALSYLGVPPNGVMIWGSQLVTGGDPGGYQPTGVTTIQNETRRYVKVNTAEGMAWDSGELTRSAWLDESVWGNPLGADESNLIQQHEIGFDADDKPMRNVYAETGYTELGDGTAMMLIDQCHPDMKWFGSNGGVEISLRAANYPQGPKHLYGPWSITPLTQWFNPRVRARYVAVRYDWLPELGFSARVGATTFHVKAAGRLP